MNQDSCLSPIGFIRTIILIAVTFRNLRPFCDTNLSGVYFKNKLLLVDYLSLMRYCTLSFYRSIFFQPSLGDNVSAAEGGKETELESDVEILTEIRQPAG